MTIALLNLRFFAYHGFYPVEQILGNEFFVDLKIDTAKKTDNDLLDTTVNYEQLFRIIDNKMSIPVKLLETLAQNILDDVTTEFIEINKAEIRIRKPLTLHGEGTIAEITLNFSR